FYVWCAGNLVVASLLARRFRRVVDRPSRAVAERQLRIGLPIHLSNVAQFLLLRADQLVLALVSGTAAVGQYSVGVNVVEALWYLPLAAGLASIPFLSGPPPAAEKQDALRRAIGMSVWLTAGGAVVLGALAPVVVPLVFGSAFHGAVVPLELLLPGVVAAAIVRIATAGLIARGRLRTLVVYTVGALAT